MTIKTNGSLPMVFSDAVASALADNQPVVALESTIITHGMPYPQNLETARSVEATVLAEGAIPATIAVLKGRLHVGLEDKDLSALAQAKDVAKLSRADLALCLAKSGTGATTVSATMIAARASGIEVFATGGIGGVHHGAETSFDISADLQELARTPVTVVCAGAKAILDIPKTLEVLETLGVPVIAYQQDNFPGFWSRDTGLSSPARMDSPLAIARAGRMRAALGLSGGQLIANPVPVEDEIPFAEMAPLIAQAQRDADAGNVVAKQVTPFLLQRLFELTSGNSLRTNIALVLNNAKLASKIAREFIVLPR